MSRLRFVVVLLPSVVGCMVAPAPPQASTPAAHGPPPAPAMATSAIQIVAGTYGASCGQPRGNVSAHLGAACNGRDRCSYQIDVHVIGDPAYGCRKDYVAEWNCDGSPQLFRAAAPPEAGYGTTLELSCPADDRYRSGGEAYVPPSPGPSAQPPPPPGFPPPPVRGMPVPPPGTRAIQVVAGSYGQNCRAPRGNTTAHLRQTCEGRPDCAYRIDHQVIGDPAYGCRKDYVAEWTCAGDPSVHRAAAGPEAGYGSIVTLSCNGAPADGGAAIAGPPPPPDHHHHGGAPGLIVIGQGSYGPNCGAPRGNVTPHLARACNGQSQCAYRVDYKVIGDPARGCQKEYVAEWTCGQQHQIHRAVAPPEAGFGAVLQLSCP